MKILVAEDEKDIRELIVFTLRIVGGFDVYEVGNGAEAVAQAPAILPDLILMDVRMPRMNGYEACEQIKTLPATKDIPIVFLSAKGQESEINMGLRLGAEAYILKPFAPDELIDQVKDIMANVARRRQFSQPNRSAS